MYLKDNYFVLLEEYEESNYCFTPEYWFNVQMRKDGFENKQNFKLADVSRF